MSEAEGDRVATPGPGRLARAVLKRYEMVIAIAPFYR
jgi:hypothetical protein